MCCIIRIFVQLSVPSIIIFIILRAQKPNFLLCKLLEADADPVLINVHFILIMVVKVSFQYLIPNKSYNRSYDLQINHSYKAHGAIFSIEVSVIEFPDFDANFAS